MVLVLLLLLILLSLSLSDNYGGGGDLVIAGGVIVVALCMIMMVMALTPMLITTVYNGCLWGVYDYVHQKGQGANFSSFVSSVRLLIPCSIVEEGCCCCCCCYLYFKCQTKRVIYVCICVIALFNVLNTRQYRYKTVMMMTLVFIMV